jgi:anti-anti-sigma factor
VEPFDRSADDGVAIISLSGELDASDTSWTDELDAALQAGRVALVVDLRNVTFIDSSVVRALILAHKRVGEKGWVHLVYTHHLINRVLQMCGLAETFPQYTTVEAALRSAPTKVAAHRGAPVGADAVRAESARKYLMSADPLGGSDDDER